MLLAGDIGGTKTLLGLFEAAVPRPRPITHRSFVTLDYDDLPSIITEFTRDLTLTNGAIEGACFGVAGPVINDTAELTNVPWKVDARHIAERFGVRRVALLNDLQSLAYGLTVLDSAELCVLQDGKATHNVGNRCQRANFAALERRPGTVHVLRAGKLKTARIAIVTDVQQVRNTLGESIEGRRHPASAASDLLDRTDAASRREPLDGCGIALIYAIALPQTLLDNEALRREPVSIIGKRHHAPFDLSFRRSRHSR